MGLEQVGQSKDYEPILGRCPMEVYDVHFFRSCLQDLGFYISFWVRQGAPLSASSFAFWESNRRALEEDERVATRLAIEEIRALDIFQGDRALALQLQDEEVRWAADTHTVPGLLISQSEG